MNEQRVIIYISATKQTTTAKWHLEGMYPSDLWVAVLDDITDLKPFPMFSKVSVTFMDRVIEAEFYCGNGTLIQKDCSKLDFWIGKQNKESEEKSMLHNVTVIEDKVLEEYWCVRAIKTDFNNAKKVVGEMEYTSKPTLNEIAAFLKNSGGDFVSVVQNYRFENELPFC